MNNQLVKINQNQNQMSITELSSLSEAFIKSGYFKDTSTMFQAMVKIQAGQEIGIAPFAAMTGIHIISGKPVIGSGIIASRVKSSHRYDYKVVQLDNEVCILDFYENGENIGTSKFTMEDAKKAGTGSSNNGTGKNIDKYPRNMLFARAISNGVKWYCSDIFLGPVYVYEEMGVEVDENGNPIVEKPEDSELLKKNVEKYFNLAKDFDSLQNTVAGYLKKYPNLVNSEWFETLHQKRLNELKASEEAILELSKAGN
jgi:hypothetical protein